MFGKTKKTKESLNSSDPNSFQSGLNAYDTKDYKRAFEIFSFRSKNLNEPASHLYLGYLYENGWGVNFNYKKAFDLYLLSFDGGYKLAANQIGLSYEHGIVTENSALAFKYYKIAADNDDTYGMINPGQCMTEVFTY